MSKRILVLLLVLGLSTAGHAYVRTTNQQGVPIFDPDKKASIAVGVGSRGQRFSTATAEAAGAWNRAGTPFRFSFESSSNPPPAACTSRQINDTITVDWASSACEDSWGDLGIIAVTIYWAAPGGRMMDADILFDATIKWGIYQGPWRAHLAEFGRVVLHELGHALGLDHPDDHGQRRRAIMNSASEEDRLMADDVAGIRAIYGMEQTVPVTKGTLENPGPDATKTGVGIVSGWVCDADKVEVELGQSRVTVAYKMLRNDTRSVCGDADNGFVVLVNWNLLGPGTHRVRLLADGRELVSRKVAVYTFGKEFLIGQEAYWILEDWPTANTDTIIGWTEALQNIEIVEIIP